MKDHQIAELVNRLSEMTHALCPNAPGMIRVLISKTVSDYLSEIERFPCPDLGHWNPVGTLPPTNTPLRIKLVSGGIIDGIRPVHVANRRGNKGFCASFSDRNVLINDESIDGWQYA